MTEKSAPAVREIWLDGLRGVAALIVAWFHMTSGKLSIPYRSFWDSPATENRHLIQLLPFRLFFAGPGMVDIFFVVSGYSVSTGLIKLRNEHGSTSLAGFYQKLSSSVVRRMFRLCFPVLAMGVVSHVLFYAGLYTLPFPKDTGCPSAVPWGNPVPHVACLVRSFVEVVNVEGYQNLTLNSRKSNGRRNGV